MAVKSKPEATQPPPKLRAGGRRRLFSITFLEDVFFLLSTGFAFYLAILVVKQQGSLLVHVLCGVAFWAIIAYLAMPRFNQVMTSIYVPDYFMGRTRGSDGVLGEPVNLAVLGSAPQVHTAMQNGGWILADPVNLRSSWGIVVSSVLRRSYPAAPVSPLFLLGRMQDFSYQQEVDGNAAQRHHVRFFKTPPDWVLPGGHRVDWLASGSYDRAVGLSWFTGQVTHKIDADIDVERDHIIATVTAADPRVTVKVIRDFSTGYHSRNGGGDLLHTDGDLPVLQVQQVVPDADVQEPVDHATKNVGARPVSVILAAALSVLSTVVSTSRGMHGLVTDPSSLPAEPGVSLDAVRWTAVSVVMLLAVGMLVLAFKTYQGRAWARVGLMGLSALSLASHVGIGHTTLMTLVDMAIDLGIMYSLTASGARAWTGPPTRQNLPGAGPGVQGVRHQRS